MGYGLVKKIRKIGNIFLVLTAITLAGRFLLIPYIFPRQYKELIEKNSEKYDLEPSLVYGVIFVESRFDQNAQSAKDAKGLMQIRDITGEWGAQSIGITNYDETTLFSPDKNIEIGCWYLNKLNTQFDYQEETILAAYNAGSGNVSGWLKDLNYSDDEKTLNEIPFGETKRYVKKVLAIKKIYDVIY